MWVRREPRVVSVAAGAAARRASERVGVGDRPVAKVKKLRGLPS